MASLLILLSLLFLSAASPGSGWPAWLVLRKRDSSLWSQKEEEEEARRRKRNENEEEESGRQWSLVFIVEFFFFFRRSFVDAGRRCFQPRPFFDREPFSFFNVTSPPYISTSSPARPEPSAPTLRPRRRSGGRAASSNREGATPSMQRRRPRPQPRPGWLPQPPPPELRPPCCFFRLCYFSPPPGPWRARRGGTGSRSTGTGAPSPWGKHQQEEKEQSSLRFSSYSRTRPRQPNPNECRPGSSRWRRHTPPAAPPRSRGRNRAGAARGARPEGPARGRGARRRRRARGRLQGLPRRNKRKNLKSTLLSLRRSSSAASRVSSCPARVVSG